jgi:hypothetical protein
MHKKDSPPVQALYFAQRHVKVGWSSKPGSFLVPIDKDTPHEVDEIGGL